MVTVALCGPWTTKGRSVHRIDYAASINIPVPTRTQSMQPSAQGKGFCGERSHCSRWLGGSSTRVRQCDRPLDSKRSGAFALLNNMSQFVSQKMLSCICRRCILVRAENYVVAHRVGARI